MKISVRPKYSLLFVFWFFISLGYAQTPENNISSSKELLGMQALASDTTINSDSTAIVADSTSVDSLQTDQTPKSDISTTIKYSARDSINFSVDSKIVKLYGDAKIKYGLIELEADHIIIDYASNTLSAVGRKDSLGRKVGFPIFKNGPEVYETKDITYNFKTGRARITEVVTKQGEGYLHGETVFKNSQNELFSINNYYTTCDLAHPHYQIKAWKTKAIPDDKIVSGPFNLEINNVPTPLGFFFGMFPSKNEASSGIIIPSYGEERRRGFFLRGGGYFFDFNEYIKATLRGDIYSKGGHGVDFSTTYRKRYSYAGNLNFTYTKLKASDNIEDQSAANDYRLTWSHSPESKGTSRFSASVNAATSTYNQNNYLGFESNSANQQMNNLTRKLSSNISYSKTFQGTPFSLGVSMRHNQDVAPRELGGGQVDLLLPSLSLNMANVYPFRGKSGASDSWLDKINIRYNMAGTNEVTNNLGRIGSDARQDSIAPFDFNNFGNFLNDAKRGVRHTIPLSTSFNVFKYFTATPSISYEEKWYFEQLNWGIDPGNPNRAIVTDTLDGFNRVSTYNFSTGFSTRLYGTYFFKKGSIKAIRHVMNPNISFSYQPDFSAEKFGYFQRLETEEGELVRSRYQGFVYGTPSIGKSGSIGLSVNNTLEMKVDSKKDTSNQAVKVPLLNNFGFSTSYNIVADSFKLAPIGVRANTSIFNNKLNINVNGTIDPYQYVLDSTAVNSRDETVYYQRRIDEYAWNTGNGLGQIASASIALSTNLNAKARESDEETRDKVNNSNLSESDKMFLLYNPEYYVNFNIPWSLRINYSLNYSKRGFQESVITQTLRLSGDFSLTENWKIIFNTGYDFENKELTATTLGISRNLHCWEMNLNWTPFGVYTNYNFTIRVKSALLQDLKMNRTRSFYDR